MRLHKSLIHADFETTTTTKKNTQKQKKQPIKQTNKNPSLIFIASQSWQFWVNICLTVMKILLNTKTFLNDSEISLFFFLFLIFFSSDIGVKNNPEISLWESATIWSDAKNTTKIK